MFFLLPFWVLQCSVLKRTGENEIIFLSNALRIIFSFPIFPDGVTHLTSSVLNAQKCALREWTSRGQKSFTTYPKCQKQYPNAWPIQNYVLTYEYQCLFFKWNNLRESLLPQGWFSIFKVKRGDKTNVII